MSVPPGTVKGISSGHVDDWVRRAFDIVASAGGLIVLSPLLLLVAVIIKATSSGEVLFRQQRVGLGGKPFKILKFRTMRTDAEKVGGQLTVGNDARITPVGRFLRAWKIDELPQLINVLKGDMSLVGPRPEVPRYVALYTPIQRQVLAVRPGITDPASIAFRSESELMANHEDPERFYIDSIMPEKLRINLEYLQRRSILADIGVLLDTVKAVFLRGN